MTSLKAALLMVLAGLHAGTVHAARAVPDYGAVEGGPSVLLSNADGSNPYMGIVRYEGRAQCTGVFLESRRDEDAASAPAYVLTNGHCSDFPGANDVLDDRPAPERHRVIFNYFADTTGRQLVVSVRRIAYATMKGRDLAVLELAARYDDIIRQSFEPWPVTLTLPARDEPMVIVGAPVLADTRTSYLRLAACRLESRATLVLEYIWHWFDFHRNECADILPGSSGSPVISRLTGRLLGLINTGTIGSVPLTECFLNHPCEPSESGVIAYRNTSYVTPLVRVDRCFDEGGQFDLQREGCPLDRDEQVRLTPSFLADENPQLPTTPLGRPPRRRWDVTVSGPFDFYRYKIVPAAGGDCRDLRGYSLSQRVSDRSLIDDLLPQFEGYSFLCVIGGTETRWGSAWQSLDHPTIVSVRIDTRPPQIPARITIIESDTAWSVAFATLIPEISSYTFKFGRPGETRCEDATGYRPMLIPFLALPKINRPYLFCAIPYDTAGNAGSLFEVLLP